MGLESFFDWFKEQAGYVLFIVLIIGIFVTGGVKRAWIAMIGGVIIGCAFIGVFIISPDIIKNISEFATEKLSLNN